MIKSFFSYIWTILLIGSLFAPEIYSAAAAGESFSVTSDDDMRTALKSAKSVLIEGLGLSEDTSSSKVIQDATGQEKLFDRQFNKLKKAKESETGGPLNDHDKLALQIQVWISLINDFPAEYQAGLNRIFAPFMAPPAAALGGAGGSSSGACDVESEGGAAAAAVRSLKKPHEVRGGVSDKIIYFHPPIRLIRAHFWAIGDTPYFITDEGKPFAIKIEAAGPVDGMVCYKEDLGIGSVKSLATIKNEIAAEDNRNKAAFARRAGAEKEAQYLAGQRAWRGRTRAEALVSAHKDASDTELFFIFNDYSHCEKAS